MMWKVEIGGKKSVKVKIEGQESGYLDMRGEILKKRVAKLCREM